MDDFSPVTDKQGNACYTWKQACALARFVGEDKAQPFVLDSSCSYRAELMIGRMLAEKNIDPSAVGRAYIFATQSPLDPAALAEGRVMHAKEGAFGALTLDDFIAADKGNELQILKDEGIGIQQYRGQGVNVTGPNREGWTRSDGEYIGYGLSFGNKNPSWWDSHATASLRVLDDKTGESRFMLLDHALFDRDEPISFAEWKAEQNCDSAICVNAPVGRKGGIVVESLNAGGQKKLEGLLDAIAPSGQPLAERLARLDSRKYDGVLRDMLGDFAGPGQQVSRVFAGLTPRKFPDIAPGVEASADYEDLKGDWNEMPKAKQQELVSRWVHELRPLKMFEDWVLRQHARIVSSPKPEAGLARSCVEKATL